MDIPLTAIAGFAAGASLIIAIGAQNAFVLRTGIRRQHVFAVVLVCALSDIVLIAAGVAGIGALVKVAPLALDIARWAGAAFLFGYAALAFRRAIRPAALEGAGSISASLASTVLTCLALTWLNPHVYLDTVALLGSLAVTHGERGRWVFAAGAGLASILWFTALGYGARLLGPLFAKPRAWRVLDGAIGLLMIVLAVMLLVRG